ncbi:MAG: carbamoyltransferase HypF, partial [Desulfobacteraceae bacterium]|nr:carbamoyltransferase HypF [Desulfobacteraceae bacterium]
MRERRKIRVNGIVQGVGFRPFIFNLAHHYKLTGFVSNTSEGVVIEAEGRAETLDQFQTAIRSKAPPLAFIIDLSHEVIIVNGDHGFVIIPSDGKAKVATLISPDIAVCNDCLQDLRDPVNRRYRYPFTNCTNCGPRYTIIEELPYDRQFTSMRNFKMCHDCQAEYDNPLDRRFHAQPNACPECGPQVELVDSHGDLVIARGEAPKQTQDEIPRLRSEQAPQSHSDPIASASQLLRQGKVLAIKGLGGFLLACDA